MCAENHANTGASRRRFMEAFLGTGIVTTIASFLYPVLRYLVPPPVADLGADDVVAGKVAELKPNAGKIFRFGNRPGLLMMGSDGTYHAVSATCTHLGCTVQYRSDVQQIWCACHNGMYDINGRNVSGPPPRPLDAFDVHVRGDDIVVSRNREA